jgi:DNA-binding CsgD family transcriptional regulator
MELKALASFELSWPAGDQIETSRHARACLEYAEAAGDPTVLAGALARLAALEFSEGNGVRFDLLRRAAALEIRPDGPPYMRPEVYTGQILSSAGFLDEARPIFENLHRLDIERGDEAALPYALFQLAELECHAGRWERADRYADQALEASRQTGQITEVGVALRCKAWVDAHRGRLGSARGLAMEALAIAPVSYAREEVFARGCLGFIELSAGNPEAARDWIDPLPELVAGKGFLLDPGLQRFVPDLVEALVSMGELRRAKEVLEPFEEAAGRLDRAWALATAARCRALLLAALGDAPGALVELEGSLAEHARAPFPFDLGRTLLVVGATQRRMRQRRAGRESLGHAVEIFESLGAPLWVGKARAELARIGGRAPSRWELTPAEDRLARMVAEGLTNREVAAALFTSVNTVQSVLKSVFRKMGVRSRTELASRLARQPSGESDPGP